MKPNISLITLGVRDVGPGTPLCERLGWTAASQQGEVAFFELEGVVLGLLRWDDLAGDASLPASDGSGFRGQSLAHNELSPEDC